MNLRTRVSCRARLIIAYITFLLRAWARPGVKYRAAVVELTSFRAPHNATRASAIELMLRNVARADSFTAQAAAQGAQIVVFAEDYADSGWSIPFGQVPLYAEALPEPGRDSLCTDGPSSTPVARALACSAKMHGLIIVTGLIDQGPCVNHLSPFTKQRFPCDPSTNETLFNSQAAFGRDGQLLAKYHKSHLARAWDEEFEPQWAESDTIDLVSFESHFGVKFGMFICNDINFGGPARGLIEAGVRDFLFSTFWISSTPWLTAIGIQDGFARSHGVNVLASNSDLRGRFSSGSGIWPADLSARFVQHYNPTNKTSDGWMGIVDMISPSDALPLPEPVKHPPGAPPVNPFNYSLGRGTNASFTFAVPGQAIHIAMAVENVSCTIEAQVATGRGTYALIAASGLLSAGWYSGLCAFVACASPSLAGCTYVPSESIPGGGASFSKVRLQMSAAHSNTFFPTALCEGGTVPSPRSSLQTTGGSADRIFDLKATCQLMSLSVDSRAQTDNEVAECPPGTKQGAPCSTHRETSSLIVV